MRHKKWEPMLEPDIVVYNAVLNACVPLHQWKGISWVFDQLRKTGLRPNGATYGLAMEVLIIIDIFTRTMFQSSYFQSKAAIAICYKMLITSDFKALDVRQCI
ncbi:hypothetical protein F3Y22_tig00117034pilonHSYRG00910 [Hibiscus syriacus]|uniref:Uncharacterized protein n=1 Tax=Hibiscus syriacus TaxID=106335 RepID=A0A6A2WZR2_HIBSY|nr:hypothetical protein F3Y22_tig00117034pilonHSYRG00910 [Hibiscus syriacus]